MYKYLSIYAGPILESKGMHANFQKKVKKKREKIFYKMRAKRTKYLKIWAKMDKI